MGKKRKAVNGDGNATSNGACVSGDDLCSTERNGSVKGPSRNGDGLLLNVTDSFNSTIGKVRVRTPPNKRSVIDDGALTSALALGTLGMAGFVCVDAFCRPWRSDLPDLPILILTTVLMSLGAPLAHVAASWTIPSYELWQPFKGGDYFIIMHALGWFFFSTWLVFIAIILNARVSGHAPIVYGNGVLSFVGFLGFVSILLLVLSPRHYKRGESWVFPWGRLIRKQKETLLAAAVISMAFCTTVFVDVGLVLGFFDAWIGARILRFGVIAYSFAVSLTHWIGYSIHSPGFKLYQPFQGGFKFVLLQSLGWTGYSVCLYAFLSLDVVSEFPMGSSSLLAWLMLLSCGMLLYSIEHFEQRSRPPLMVWTGERLASFMLSVIAASIFFLIEYLHWQYGPSPPLSYFNLSLFGGILLFAVPIGTQYLASKQENGYAFFQPFIGGTRFVVMQAFGWTIFTATLIAWILFMLNQSWWRHVFAVGIFGFLSNTTILISPTYFEPGTVPSDARQFINGELVLSTLLAMGGVALMYVVDVLEDAVFPRQQLLGFAIMVILSATIFAQFCGRKVHENFKAIQPFEGGAEFVALQSMAWTIYSIMLVFYVVLLLNFDHLGPSVKRPWLTICGVVGILPWGIVLVSISYYQDVESTLPFSDVQVSLSFRNNCQLSNEFLEQLEDLMPRVTNADLGELLISIFEQYRDRKTMRPLSAKPDRSFHPVATLAATGIEVFAFTLCAIADVFDAAIPGSITHAGTVVMSLGVFLLSLPPVIVHCKTGPNKYINYKLWQPFRGGFNFVLLQTIGWALYSISCCMSLMLLFSRLFPKRIGAPEVYGLNSLTAIFGTGSYCVILLSLKHFRPNRDPAKYCGQDSFFQRNAEWTVSTLITLGASALFMAVESVRNKWGDMFEVAPVFFLGGLALFASIPLLVIAIRKSRKMRPAEQEFYDGPEVFGWIMYGVQAALATVIFCQGALAIIPLHQLSELVLVVAGVTVIAQTGSYLVIFWNEGRTLRTAFLDALEEVAANVVAMLMYLMPLVIYILWVFICFGVRKSTASTYFFVYMHLLTFSGFQMPIVTIIKAATGIGLAVGCYSLFVGDFDSCFWCTAAFLYSCTYRDAHITGARLNRAWTEATWFWSLIGKYFGFSVLVDEDNSGKNGKSLREELVESGRPLLFGFHPHGIYPLTCVYATRHEQWCEKIGVQPSCHAATIIFATPLMREVAMYLGGRDVSRVALDKQLSTGGAALLVPGGQAEMRLSLSGSTEMSLVGKHKGFIRLAMQHGASLVPVFSFGEHDILDNVRMPETQKWFLRTMGFGYPHFPYGRMFLPVPRRKRVTVVVGYPIRLDKSETPTPAEVDKVHKQYYHALTDLVERNKVKCGYPNLKLNII